MDKKIAAIHELLVDCEQRDLAAHLTKYAAQADENMNRLVSAREAFDRWNEANGNQLSLVVAIGECLGATGEPRVA